MIIRLKRRWSFIRLLRLAVGLAGTVQGILTSEYELSIGGFLLVYMAIADSVNESEYELEVQEIHSSSKEAGYEKVGARL